MSREMPNKNLFMLKLVGNRKFERYVIEDVRQDYHEPRYWCGKPDHPWTSSEVLAKKHADSGSAENTLNDEVIPYEYANHPVTEMVLPLKFTIRGNASKEEFAKYLHRALVFLLETAEHGPGPNPDVYVTVDTNLNDLKLVGKEPISETPIRNNPQGLSLHAHVKIKTGPNAGQKGIIAKFCGDATNPKVKVRIRHQGGSRVLEIDASQLELVS